MKPEPELPVCSGTWWIFARSMHETAVSVASVASQSPSTWSRLTTSFRFLVVVHTCSRIFNRRISAATAPNGRGRTRNMLDDARPSRLTSRQTVILSAIDEYCAATGEPCPSRYLARRLSSHHSTIQEHVASLYRKGWLRAPNAPSIPSRPFLRKPRQVGGV